MSIEDFLAWEARQEIKFEFDGYEPVAMAGGTVNHARMQRNLAISIGGRLRGQRCEFVGSDLKLVSSKRSRYPDGQVVCGVPDGDATFVTTPVVLFEVISPGDEQRDRVTKSAEYLRVGSVQTYVILEQDEIAASVATRTGNVWSIVNLGRLDALKLSAVGIEVPLAELYEGIDLT